MDGSGENRFLAGGAEISRRGGGHSVAPVHIKAKGRIIAKPEQAGYANIRKQNDLKKEAAKCSS